MGYKMVSFNLYSSISIQSIPTDKSLDGKNDSEQCSGEHVLKIKNRKITGSYINLKLKLKKN